MDLILPRLDKVEILTIYLGNQCNFDCNYCDRGYINSIGSQAVSRGVADEMYEFIKWVASQPNNVQYISLHGGEPLLFANRINQIMKWLAPLAKDAGWNIGITTNGSLVKKHEWLFEKYSGHIRATVSYDFMFQEENRDELDVMEMAEVLNKHSPEWKWQTVIPINDPRCFSFPAIQNIVNTCYATGCRTINVIPLRHHRGKDKFDVLIDRIDLEQFLGAFIDFLQILYIKKLTVFIDGNYTMIDKAYFGEHQKLILSPDGYMYPEFDFLEYQMHQFRIGNWKTKEIWEPQGDGDRILPQCHECPMKAACGLKYLYKMFDEEPKGNCKKFYKYLNFATFHLMKMKDKKTMLEWIGIKDDFKVKDENRK